MTWKKGQSGNPGGRPKVVTEIRELARTYSAEAVRDLAAIARSKRNPAIARVKAWEVLLDRGYGKPPSTLPQTQDEAGGKFEVIISRTADFELCEMLIAAKAAAGEIPMPKTREEMDRAVNDLVMGRARGRDDRPPRAAAALPPPTETPIPVKQITVAPIPTAPPVSRQRFPTVPFTVPDGFKS